MAKLSNLFVNRIIPVPVLFNYLIPNSGGSGLARPHPVNYCYWSLPVAKQSSRYCARRPPIKLHRYNVAEGSFTLFGTTLSTESFKALKYFIYEETATKLI